MQRNSKITQNMEKNQSIETDTKITQLFIYISNLTSKKLFILAI